MKVLVINCGSSSLKYQLFDMIGETSLADGVVQRIGMNDPYLEHNTGDQNVKIDHNLSNHEEALELILSILQDEDSGVIDSLDDINAVGHRVVHAGEEFSSSVLIDAEVIEIIEKCSELAPLHNPSNLMGIRACQQHMPGIPQAAVFDTAFHQTMPEYAYIYGLPYKFYKEHGIRKYGFHGTSHMFVAEQAAAFEDKDIEELKIITCHLGNGASMAAVKGGQSVDTTMGFTPLDGLLMGTRSGDIDPAVVLFLINELDIDSENAYEILNKESGLLGVSGISSDARDVEESAEEGNRRAELALDLFSYRVKKYIGAFKAVMNGLDILVFTAGMGENSHNIREKVCSNMESLGIHLDRKSNQQKGNNFIISKDKSEVRVRVISTNEELIIARDTKKIVGSL